MNEKVWEDGKRQLSLELWQKGYLSHMEQLAHNRYRAQGENDWEKEARRAGEALAKRGTEESWDKIRRFIYDRDKGICYVCKTFVEWKHYECGHIVDRVCGGSDLPENLVVMCNVCNRNYKPLHATRKEFDEWMAKGGWKYEFIKSLEKSGWVIGGGK